MMYYSYEFPLPEMLSYIQFNHRELKTNSELHHWQWNVSGYMYNKCTTNVQQNPLIQGRMGEADILIVPQTE